MLCQVYRKQSLTPGADAKGVLWGCLCHTQALSFRAIALLEQGDRDSSPGVDLGGGEKLIAAVAATQSHQQ